MSVHLPIEGTLTQADEPSTYADRESGEIKTSKSRQVVLLVAQTGRTIDVAAAVGMELPEIGSYVLATVEVGARVTQFGRAAEPAFRLIRVESKRRPSAAKVA